MDTLIAAINQHFREYVVSYCPKLVAAGDHQLKVAWFDSRDERDSVRIYVKSDRLHIRSLPDSILSYHSSFLLSDPNCLEQVGVILQRFHDNLP